MTPSTTMVNRFAAGCAFLLTASSVSAGGIYLREYGQPAQGTSGVGNTVLAEDASTAFLNPAGVFNLEGDAESMVTGIVLDSSVKFSADKDNTISGSNGGDAGGIIPGAALFHARKLNDKWGLTFSLNSVAGSALDYDDDFVGRYTGTETDLLTITALPNLAYKVNDEFSVAAGIGLFYGQLELKQAIPSLRNSSLSRDGRAKIDDGDDTDFTPFASALWQATDKLRFGLNYLGETKLTFDNDLELTLPVPPRGTTFDNIATDVKIVFPQRVELGTLYELTPQVSLLANLAWEDWSELDSVPISTNRVGAKIPLNWEDIWSIGVGLRYKTGDRWTYYTGIAYDGDPANRNDQIAILPADRQIRYSAGANYELDENRKIGGTLTYIDLGNARISNELVAGTFSGKYSTFRLIALGVNFNWR